MNQPDVPIDAGTTVPTAVLHAAFDGDQNIIVLTIFQIIRDGNRHFVISEEAASNR